MRPTYRSLDQQYHILLIPFSPSELGFEQCNCSRVSRENQQVGAKELVFGPDGQRLVKLKILVEPPLSIL